MKKVGYDYGDAVLNQGANLKVSGANRMINAVVDHKQKETATGIPSRHPRRRKKKTKVKDYDKDNFEATRRYRFIDMGNTVFHKVC